MTPVQRGQIWDGDGRALLIVREKNLTRRSGMAWVATNIGTGQTTTVTDAALRASFTLREAKPPDFFPVLVDHGVSLAEWGEVEKDETIAWLCDRIRAEIWRKPGVGGFLAQMANFARLRALIEAKLAVIRARQAEALNTAHLQIVIPFPGASYEEVEAATKKALERKPDQVGKASRGGATPPSE